MEDMKYATEDVDLRSRMGDVACAIQALPAVSRWSQIHNRHIISPKPTGFNVTLRCLRVSSTATVASSRSHLAEPTHAACLLGGASRLDQAETRW